MTACVNVDPVAGAVVANHPVRSVAHVAQGNGCPEQRSFDVLGVLTPDLGVSKSDEWYSSLVKSANFVSVTTDAAPSGILHYRIVVDGLSVTNRRDFGTPCDFKLGGTSAITQRMREVATWFSMPSETGCFETAGAVDVPTHAPELPTVLGNVSPNPLMPGAQGRIRFSLAHAGRVTLTVFDLQGRLVRTLFDGVGKKGENETSWDGRDSSGHHLAAGIYFYRLRAPGFDASKKLVIVGGGQ
jgi:hypothetical protein